MPSSMPVICFICDITLKGDPEYIQHMQTVHETTHPDQAMAQARLKEIQLPKQPQVVVPLNKYAPPPPEFAEIAEMMDTKPSVQQLSSSPVVTKSAPLSQLQQEIKKIELKYHYEGTCPICNTPVRTIMIKATEKLFAVALCLTHNQLEQREVHPLDDNDKIVVVVAPNLDTNLKKEFRKEMKKHARQNILKRKEIALQDEMRPAGLPSSN